MKFVLMLASKRPHAILLHSTKSAGVYEIVDQLHPADHGGTTTALGW
jgi:hypothetical protein